MIGPSRGRMGAGRTALIGFVVIVAAALVPSVAFAGPASSTTSPVSTSAVTTPASNVSAASATTVVPPAATAHATALEVSPPNLSLGHERVGSFFIGKTAIIKNVSAHGVSLQNIAFTSGDRADFVVGTDCFPNGHPSVLRAHHSCAIKAIFTPHMYGTRTAIMEITESTLGSPRPFKLTGIGTDGYLISAEPGGVATFGDAVFKGQPKPTPLTASIVQVTPTTSGGGYWLLGADGGVFSFGNAKFFGSTGAMRLTRPVVGMASPRANNGYWLVASDGGIFNFGKVPFLGSMGGMHLNSPIVGMAATRSGKGYWLVAADGGIFTFGDAKFFGSAGSLRLAQPIVGMARTPSGNGYWLVARDGGIFTFGDAKFFGSGGGLRYGNVVGMASTPNGRGYWLSNTVGQVFVFGDAPYFGDLFRRGVSNATPVAATAPTIGPITKTPTVIDEPNAKALNALVDAVVRGRVNFG